MASYPSGFFCGGFGRMEYTIEWIGEAFLGVSSDAKRHIGMSLLKGRPVPAEFKEGDRVSIALASEIPYEPVEEATEDRAYFTITHAATGKTLTVWHETDRWLLETKS
jgi:hypothetical protein